MYFSVNLSEMNIWARCPKYKCILQWIFTEAPLLLLVLKDKFFSADTMSETKMLKHLALGSSGIFRVEEANTPRGAMPMGEAPPPMAKLLPTAIWTPSEGQNDFTQCSLALQKPSEASG